jgi:kinesin family protein 5
VEINIEDGRKTLEESGKAASASTLVISDDNDFLERENELEDQIAAKSAELEAKTILADNLKEELGILKERENGLALLNKDLSAELSELRSRVERIDFEKREQHITIDSLNDENRALKTQMENLQKKVVELSAQKEKESEVLDVEKQKQTDDKMRKMMAEFDPSSLMDEQEQNIRSNMIKLANQSKDSKPPTDVIEIESEHYELLEGRVTIKDNQSQIQHLNIELETLQKEVKNENERANELESKFYELEGEYQQLLERTIEDDELLANQENVKLIADLKQKLELYFNNKSCLQEAQNEQLLRTITRKDDEIKNLKSIIEEHMQKNDALKQGFEKLQEEPEINDLRAKMSAQIQDFDTMKKKLLRELQARCEKVIQLEISLDQTRLQYQNILNTTNTSLHIKKMTFLERNLEALTGVQKELVGQNSELKKALVVSQRKLELKIDRIKDLESLLETTTKDFEMKVGKLEEDVLGLKSKLKENLVSNSWVQSSKIAKPLRGGLDFNQEKDVFNPDKLSSPRSLTSKRSSWYISLLKK